MKKFQIRSLFTIAAAAAFLLLPLSLQAKTVKLTGTVSDTHCGLHHAMANAAKCTQGCVKMGAGYALVVGNNVYKLTGETSAAKKTLWAQAGKKVVISGDLEGTTLKVKSVKAG